MSAPATDPVLALPRVRQTYWWIQYLRGLAALGVVIFHVYDHFPQPLGRSFGIGARGVDVFFVISGFIMYMAARDERLSRFITRRLIRIVPLYWLATFFLMLLLLVFQGRHASWTETMLSLALVPHYSESHAGQIWPILVPGWTLSYELLFYALFALGIATRRVVAAPALAIVALVTLGALLKPSSAIFAVMTNPLLIEFLLGLLIALVVHRRPALLTITLVATIIFAAIAASLAGYAKDAGRVCVFATAAVMVLGAVWFERRRPGKPIPALRLFGDASYSIYLFHSPFLFLIDRLWVDRLDGISMLAANAVALVEIVAALAVGVVLHLVLEKPVLRTLNRWALK